MTTRILQDQHALAILASLAASDVPAGDHLAPHRTKHTDPAWEPYVVLYMIAGGEIDGTAADPDSDGDLRFQLTAVGRVPAEARYIADRADAALVAHRPVVAGRSVERLRPIGATPDLRRDDDVDPPLFYLVRRYGAWTFPTT